MNTQVTAGAASTAHTPEPPVNIVIEGKDFPWSALTITTAEIIKLGGWEVSSVITMQTGFPFDITEPQDRCLCDGGTQRPDSLGTAPVFVDPRGTFSVAQRRCHVVVVC